MQRRFENIAIYLFFGMFLLIQKCMSAFKVKQQPCSVLRGRGAIGSVVFDLESKQERVEQQAIKSEQQLLDNLPPGSQHLLKALTQKLDAVEASKKRVRKKKKHKKEKKKSKKAKKSKKSKD